MVAFRHLPSDQQTDIPTRVFEIRKETMAIWKRLTDAEGRQVDVNIEQICFMVDHRDYTSIYFAGIGEDLSLDVKQHLNDIHNIAPIRSADQPEMAMK